MCIFLRAVCIEALSNTIKIILNHLIIVIIIKAQFRK